MKSHHIFTIIFFVPIMQQANAMLTEAEGPVVTAVSHVLQEKKDEKSTKSPLIRTKSSELPKTTPAFKKFDEKMIKKAEEFARKSSPRNETRERRSSIGSKNLS